MTVAVLHSYTHVLGWAYFRVKGGPIFGRGVLENTPIPLFEQILNSSPMGVFSRDYGILPVIATNNCSGGINTGSRKFTWNIKALHVPASSVLYCTDKAETAAQTGIHSRTRIL